MTLNISTLEEGRGKQALACLENGMAIKLPL